MNIPNFLELRFAVTAVVILVNKRNPNNTICFRFVLGIRVINLGPWRSEVKIAFIIARKEIM